MTINDNDVRVIKTKRGLRDAFIRLLLEKGYDAISIQDIATEAETARVTFYRHYRNKEELLVDCIDMFYENVAGKIKQISNEELRQGYNPIQDFYRQIYEDGKIYCLLKNSQAGQLLIKRLTELFAERTKIQLKARFSTEELLVPIDVITHHIANSQIGLANWWIENDLPYSPEYMAQISFWLIMAGSARAFGIKEIAIKPPAFPEEK